MKTQVGIKDAALNFLPNRTPKESSGARKARDAVLAVAGGVAGGLAEEAATRKQGVEITVRKDNGRIISVVQEVSGSASVHAGDRVRVLTLGGTTRIAQ